MPNTVGPNLVETFRCDHEYNQYLLSLVVVVVVNKEIPVLGIRLQTVP